MNPYLPSTITAEQEEWMMEYGKRFMVNEAILLLSYAYAVSGYSRAAAMFGICSAFLAVLWHSAGRFLNNFRRIICFTLIQIPFILASGLSGEIETIVLLAFCNTVVSILWMESSLRALRETMMILLVSFWIFVFVSLAMPLPAEIFLMGRILPRAASLMLVLLIFMPVLCAYFVRLHRRVLK